MKSLTVLWLLVCLAIASVAEARLGGGRSSGSRGSRSVSPSRSYQAPTRPQAPNYSTAQPRSAPQPGNPMGAPSSSGAFTRGLLGGLAGGFLGSMLFRGFGYGGGGAWGGTGGIGFLDILLLLGLVYLLFRGFAGRRLFSAAAVGGESPFDRRGSEPEMTHYEKLRSVEPGPYVRPLEEDVADEIRRYDPSFELASFKEDRMDDFMRFQAAWGQRDLSALSGRVAPEIGKVLAEDLSLLKDRGEINRIENIAVRGTELIEAWAERGRQFATVRFRANLTDYTVREDTGELVQGSKTEPVKFEEAWTFVRDLDQAGPGNPWKLSAIEILATP